MYRRLGCDGRLLLTGTEATYLRAMLCGTEAAAVSCPFWVSTCGRELSRCNIDIAALSEIRISGSSDLVEEGAAWLATTIRKTLMMDIWADIHGTEKGVNKRMSNDIRNRHAHRLSKNHP